MLQLHTPLSLQSCRCHPSEAALPLFPHSVQSFHCQLTTLDGSSLFPCSNIFIQSLVLNLNSPFIKPDKSVLPSMRAVVSSPLLHLSLLSCWVFFLEELRVVNTNPFQAGDRSDILSSFLTLENTDPSLCRLAIPSSSSWCTDKYPLSKTPLF